MFCYTKFSVWSFFYFPLFCSFCTEANAQFSPFVPTHNKVNTLKSTYLPSETFRDFSRFPRFPNHFALEGNVSLKAGQFVLSPALVWQFWANFSYGIGLNVSYVLANADSSRSSPTPLHLGGKTFLRWNPKSYLPHLQGEYSANNSEKGVSHSLLTGMAYRLKILPKHAVNLGVFYDWHAKKEINSAESPWVLRFGWTTVLGTTHSFSESKAQLKAAKNACSGLDLTTLKAFKKAKLGFMFGGSFKDAHSLSVSPTISFDVANALSVGAGLLLRHTYQDSTKLNRQAAGARIFTTLKPKKWLPFFRAETTIMRSGIRKHPENPSKAKLMAHLPKIQLSLFLGMGYHFPLQSGTNLEIAVLRDIFWQGKDSELLKNQTPSPWVVRMGVMKALTAETKDFSNHLAKQAHNKAAEKIEKLKHFRLEGNIGFWLNKEGFYLDFSPVVSKLIFQDRLALGFGLSYQLNKKKLQTKTNYGGRIYLRYRPRKHIFYGQAELEQMNGRSSEPHKTAERKWYPAAFLGAGLRFPILNRSALTLTALRRLGPKIQTPIHHSPWVIRLGWLL